MAKKIYFLFAVVLFISAAVFDFTFAAETLRRPDRIEIKNLQFKQAKGGINISAVLANPSAETETYPSTYLIRLQETNPLIKPKNPDFFPSSLIVSAAEGDSDPEYIALKPLEEKTVNLFLPVSQYIPLNNYNLIVSYIYSDGRGLGTADKIIPNFGYNPKEDRLYKHGFINFDQENCYFIKSDGKKYSNTSGPIFNPDEAPKISCKLKNLGADNFYVFPRIEWKEFFVYGSPLNGRRVLEIADQPVPFEAGEEKIVEFYLPKAEKPQVYEALVSFADEKGDIRSFNMSFRWTVAGSSARVERVSPVGEIKTTYDKGDTVQLLVGYFGSMDLYWSGDDSNVKNLSGASLVAVVKDGKGNICGENKVNLPDISDGNLKEEIVDVLLKARCSQISYDVSLLADNQDLAKVSYKELTEKSGGNMSDYGVYAKYVLMAVFVFGFLFFIRKGKKYMDKKFALFGFLLVLGVFGWFYNFQDFKKGFAEIITIKEALATTPTVTTGSATSITNTTATINGTINPGGNSISYWFFYYPDGHALDLTKNTTWTSVDSGTGDVNISANISGLASGTKYYYYISAKYDGGAYLPSSAVNSFTTTGGVAPTVTTGSATNITNTSATINGTINPQGHNIGYLFFYKKSSDATFIGTTWSSAGSGTVNVNISANVSGLTLGSSYSYYIDAFDYTDNIQRLSSSGSFTTTGGAPVTAPVVTTGSATNITDNTATINGVINPQGHNIGYLFFYKKSSDTTYTGTTWSSAGSGTSDVSVSANISSLTAGTSYSYYIDAWDYTDNIQRISSTDTFTTTGTAPPLFYGIAEARPYFEPGYEINNIVGVRYKFKIANNDGIIGKIIFGSSRLKGSGTDTYLIERNIYNSKVSYFDPVCSDGWEKLNIMTVGQSTLRIAVPDYVGKGKTGLKTEDILYFPRITYFIDAIAGLIKTDVISQDNLNGKEGMVETLRGDIISDKTGWKCGGVSLDSDTYRQWNVNTSINGSLPYNVSIALPEAGAKYLTPYELINFRTEFFQREGLFKVYFWDFEFKREGGLIWEPLTKLKVSDYDGDTKNYGIKKIIYNGKNAIEISNYNPTPTEPVFFIKNDKFELPPPLPSVTTNLATNIIATEATLNGTVNPNGANNVYYKFGYNAGSGAVAYTASTLIAGTAPAPISANISGLTAGTNYSFNVILTVGDSTYTSSSMSFTTGSEGEPEKKEYAGTNSENFDESWGWGGTFLGETAKLKSHWGDGDNSYNTVALGNIAIDFDNYLDSVLPGNPVIYLENIRGNIGCSNSNSVAKVKMAIGADGLDETVIRFRKNSVSDYVDKIKLDLDSLYAGEYAKDISFDQSYKYQINPADLAKFYNDDKSLKGNPYLTVYVRMAGYPGTWSDASYFYRGFFSKEASESMEYIGSSVKHKYDLEAKALEKSGVIKVKIPLKLPDLKVDLKGAPVGQVYGDGPVAIKYGCPLNLQWENSGVNTCTASNTASPSNSEWEGLLKKTLGFDIKSGTKNFSDFQKSGDYSLSCSRYLGSSLGMAEKKDTVNISATPKPIVTLQAKNLTSYGVYQDGNLDDVSKGDKIELKWSASNASSCRLYRLVGNKRANEAVKEPTGTLTINGLYESAVYEMECFNTYVQDSATKICSSSKSQDTMIIQVLGEPPPPPSITATPNCSSETIEVSWDDTAKTSDNTTTSKKNYYTLQRNSETSKTTLYTNSYTDPSVSNGSSYTYSVQACNANGCSSAVTSDSTKYSCSPLAEYTLMIDILDGSDENATTTWKVDGTGKVTVTSDKKGTDETGNSNANFTCDKSETSTVVSCSYIFPEGSAITLSQEATNGSSFIEWGTGCGDSGDSCTGKLSANSMTLTMDSSKNITAKFNDKYNDPYYLNMNVTGVGEVSITSYNSGNSATDGIKLDEDGDTIETANKFTCSASADVTTDYPESACSYQYKYGDILYISPSAGTDYSFPNNDYDGAYWNYNDDGDCISDNVSYSYGKGTCKLTMDSDKGVGIYFAKTMSETYDPDDPPSTTNNNLIINILDLYDSNLDVDKFIDGTGKVVVSSNYSGTDENGNNGTTFSCEKKGDISTSCSYSFPEGSEITLKQQATLGTFVEWATCDTDITNCNKDTSTGSGDKTVLLGTDKYITAAFNDKTNDYYTLTVDILDATDFTGTTNDKYVDGTGNVSVGSDKSGTDETGDSDISSGADTSFTCKKSESATAVSCYYKFIWGSVITLNQTPATGSFIEWGTGCDGYGDNCTGKSSANSAILTMDGDKNITAKFNDTTNDDEIVEEEPGQAVELSANESLYANIVENLPANSNKVTITVSSQTYEGPLTLSANIAQTGLNGATAEFSSGETIDVTSGSWTDVEFRIKSISGSKSAGIYPLEITATDQDGNKYTLTVNLNLTKTTVEWREI